MMLKICKYCGKQFQSDRSMKQFCSQECNVSYMKQESIKRRTVKCLNCGKEFIARDHRNRFCSNQCAGFYNGQAHRKHTDEVKLRIRSSLIKYSDEHRVYRKGSKSYRKRYCMSCGKLLTECENRDLCRHYIIRKKSPILQKLGFDFSKLGSVEIYQEYDRIRNYLVNLYYVKGLSLRDICDRHKIQQTVSLTKIFNMFKLELKNIDFSFNEYPQFKKGWHITWDNKQVYYRSKYEHNFCMYLDNNKIHYEMEYLRIPYFDTYRNCMRIAIPDFYIPAKSLIVEIKGDFTYDRNDMINRFKAYKKLGYDYKLILEGKDYGKKLPENRMKTIRQYFK